MQPRDSQTLHLPSGRTLAYAEYGSPTGKPLIYFHGFPTSRLEASIFHRLALQRNIRILAPDRPGFGLSTYDPHRQITDWPVDVRDFVNRLGLERFAVLGVSGGGPYAIACARGLPKEMLTAVGVLAGAPVWNGAWRTEGVPWYSRVLCLAANYVPGATGWVATGLVGAVRWLMGQGWMVKRLDRFMERAVEKDENFAAAVTFDRGLEMESPVEAVVGDVRDDERQLARAKVQRREWLIGQTFEGFAQGTTGFIHETQLLTRDWGFKFEDVTYDKVCMWHGSKDANAPPMTIREMARRMPNCVLKETDDTHFTMYRHFEEVLDQLVPPEKKTI